MVEELPKGPAGAPAEKKQIRFGIRQVMRSAIQVVTHVGDTGTRQIQFLKTDLVRDGAKKFLSIDVQNIGERWLRPFLSADLVTDKGVSLGRFDGGRWRLFPGTSVRYTIDFGAIPDGKYKALVVLDNKDESVFGAQYNLDFSANAVPVPARAPAVAAKSEKRTPILH